MSSYYGSMLCVFWSIFRAELGDVKGGKFAMRCESRRTNYEAKLKHTYYSMR